MLESYGIYIAVGFAVIAILLIGKIWGDGLYTLTKNWRLASFVLVLSLLGVLVVIKQEEFKYELVYYYYAGNQSKAPQDTKYRIRQCKDFVQAKLNGGEAIETRPIKAGFINVSAVNNWDFCAKTFGLNYWEHDISINGQSGGRVLCEAYARDTYRSGKVQTWCDTVFATDQKI